jgi:hypothetical protein
VSWVFNTRIRHRLLFFRVTPGIRVSALKTCTAGISHVKLCGRRTCNAKDISASQAELLWVSLSPEVRDSHVLQGTILWTSLSSYKNKKCEKFVRKHSLSGTWPLISFLLFRTLKWIWNVITRPERHIKQCHSDLKRLTSATELLQKRVSHTRVNNNCSTEVQVGKVKKLTWSSCIHT